MLLQKKIVFTFCIMYIFLAHNSVFWSFPIISYSAVLLSFPLKFAKQDSKLRQKDMTEGEMTVNHRFRLRFGYTAGKICFLFHEEMMPFHFLYEKLNYTRNDQLVLL